MDQFHLSWSHGNATVFADGAALHHLTFDLGGRLFSPFAEAPWQDDYLDHPHPDHHHEDYPRHLQLLGGNGLVFLLGPAIMTRPITVMARITNGRFWPKKTTPSPLGLNILISI